MPVLRIGMLICLLGISGCCPCGCLVKRQSEMNCPTDIRQTVPWCAGEDAIFHCPCGPDNSFYGYKPTCWSVWPAPGAEWRDAQCSPQLTDCDGEQRGDHPAALPTLVPGHVEEIAPGTPPARDVRLEHETDSTLSEMPVPNASTGGQWPTEQTSGPRLNKQRELQYRYQQPTETTGDPLWQKTAANVHKLPPTSQPRGYAFLDFRADQSPRTLASYTVRNRNREAPLHSVVPSTDSVVPSIMFQR